MRGFELARRREKSEVEGRKDVEGVGVDIGVSEVVGTMAALSNC